MDDGVDAVLGQQPRDGGPADVGLDELGVPELVRGLHRVDGHDLVDVFVPLNPPHEPPAQRTRDSRDEHDPAQVSACLPQSAVPRQPLPPHGNGSALPPMTPCRFLHPSQPGRPESARPAPEAISCARLRPEAQPDSARPALEATHRVAGDKERGPPADRQKDLVKHAARRLLLVATLHTRPLQQLAVLLLGHPLTPLLDNRAHDNPRSLLGQPPCSPGVIGAGLHGPTRPTSA